MRPAVERFAAAMEDRLRLHDRHKGEVGWVASPVTYLLKRLHDEVVELENTVFERCSTPADIAREATDVANFAMMIADNKGQLRKKAEEPPAPREE